MAEIYVFTAGGIVNTIRDELHNELEFIVFDEDNWESGYCPICEGDNVDLKDADKRVNPNGLDYYSGGHMECLDCGARDDMDEHEYMGCYREWEEENDRG